MLLNPLGRRAGPSVVVLASVVAACGSVGGPSGGSGAEATEAGLLATVQSHAQAFIDAPGNTYDYFSASCQASVERAEWAGEMRWASSMMESFYGFSLDEMKIGDIEIVSFDDDTGSVAETLAGPNGETLDDEGDPTMWHYESGRWVTDDCETTTSASEPEVSTETALGWPEKFCDLEIGMTRDEVRTIMGEPTTEFLDESSPDSYDAYPFGITIFYEAPRAQDPDPMKVRVQSLSPEVTGQFTELTLEDIALFPCADSVFDEATLDAATANG